MTFDFDFFLHVFPLIAKGLPMTFLVTVVPMVIGLVLAFFMAVFVIYKTPVLSQLVKVHVSIVRGVPLYVLLFVGYYWVPYAIGGIAKLFGGAGKSVMVSGPMIAIICFTLHISGYLSEVVRSALNATNKDQMEAAESIGMTMFQAYTRIIIPQAAIAALPNYANMFTTILKSSSLVFTIAVLDITAIAKVEAETGFNFLESYAVLIIMYLFFCTLFTKAFRALEKALKTRTSQFQG